MSSRLIISTFSQCALASGEKGAASQDCRIVSLCSFLPRGENVGPVAITLWPRAPQVVVTAVRTASCCSLLFLRPPESLSLLLSPLSPLFSRPRKMCAPPGAVCVLCNGWGVFSLVSILAVGELVLSGSAQLTRAAGKTHFSGQP